MGLDMYLTADRYVSKYMEEDASNALNNLDIHPTANANVVGITYDIMYWRKANAIHKWFVDKCQNGVDECQRSYVSHEQIDQLVQLCKSVLENKKLAHNLLPAQEGFFFGGTEYNEWYFENLQDTVNSLEHITKHYPVGYYRFMYQSSW
jgi:hypothetical protein